MTLWEGMRAGLQVRRFVRCPCARNHLNGSLQPANPGVSIHSVEFLGYYFQGACTVWQRGGIRFSPFVRWEN